MALLALCATPSTASALDLSTVNFRNVTGQGQPGALLDTMVVANGQTCHFTEDDLDPLLTQASSQKAMVQYWSDSTSAEVHVFARDPAELSRAVRIEAKAELTGDDAGLGWDPFIDTPSMSNKVSVPYDVVVPYPNMDSFSFIPGSSVAPSEVFFSEGHFAGWTPHVLASPVDLPNGTGSVKGVRIHDHGRCSAGAQLEPIYDEMQDGAWCKLKVLARNEGIDVLRWYTHVITQLDRPDNSFFTQVEDGFLMNAHFLAIIPDPGSDVDVHAKMESVFSLKNGHLQVSQKGTDVVDTYCTGAGGFLCPDDTVKDAVTDAIVALREGIEDQADRTQSVGLGACNLDAADPCKKVRDQLALLVEDGAMTLAAQGRESFDKPAGEVDSMMDAVRNPSLWTCDKGEDVIDKIIAGDECNPVTEEDLERLNNPTCRIFVPASRLNVYPDEVELVWFDGKEVKNPAYALWVALQSPFAPDAEQSEATLCASQQNSYTEIDSYTREYASTRRGVMYASQDY